MSAMGWRSNSRQINRSDHAVAVQVGLIAAAAATADVCPVVDVHLIYCCHSRRPGTVLS